MIDSFFPFSATTGPITVRVAVSYLPEQSHPALGRWFWAYHVRIENHGEVATQLISRHWRISDGRGQESEVEGEGVVGEQPLILPAGRSIMYRAVRCQRPKARWWAAMRWR